MSSLRAPASVASPWWMVLALGNGGYLVHAAISENLAALGVLGSSTAFCLWACSAVRPGSR